MKVPRSRWWSLVLLGLVTPWAVLGHAFGHILDRKGVWLVAGHHRVPARFEEGHSKEEKMAAVHYLRFPLTDAARIALRDPAQPLRIVVDHPNYRAEAEVPPAVRDELIADLT